MELQKVQFETAEPFLFYYCFPLSYPVNTKYFSAMFIVVIPRRRESDVIKLRQPLSQFSGKPGKIPVGQGFVVASRSSLRSE
ncbi:hypothetical protein DU508_04850 [Pedobacter chinensis]|uniref:Uncharacterized protein n=1 Tax=Pedobacter chinensis TaxID=2282421 RepID=A0A369Q4Q9_9SPHI|nr:hypothetical protein DU508_04850 [Pedobacter chinensis]